GDADVPRKLRELSRLLRQADHLDPDAQRELADLMDELAGTLSPAVLQSAEAAHLADSTAHLARALQRPHDTGLLSAAKTRLAEVPPPPPRELIYLRFPLLDGVGNRGELLFLAVSTVATLLKMHVPLLLICGGGVSRSPAVAAAALSLADGEAPEACLRRVVQ